MRSEGHCDGVHELVPELALGIAVGEERARGLAHVAACYRCRRSLDELSELADELLLLAPPHEPPLGFESRVVRRIAPAEPTRRRGRTFAWRWRMPVLAAATVMLAAAVAGSSVYVATEEDRELGALYQQTLEIADGKAFGALPLQRADGRRAGLVFGYEGSPSWLFVVVSLPRSGRWDVHVDTRRGATFRLGTVAVTGAEGSFGSILPVSLFDVARVRVVSRESAPTLRVEIPPPPA